MGNAAYERKRPRLPVTLLLSADCSRPNLSTLPKNRQLSHDNFIWMAPGMLTSRSRHIGQLYRPLQQSNLHLESLHETLVASRTS